jgi:DNA repair protein RecN (Recombination protein N)
MRAESRARTPPRGNCQGALSAGFPARRNSAYLPRVLAHLVSLRIRNLALVEELAWQLRPGFTAITGETGSGKSIIVGR